MSVVVGSTRQNNNNAIRFCRWRIVSGVPKRSKRLAYQEIVLHPEPGSVQFKLRCQFFPTLYHSAGKHITRCGAQCDARSVAMEMKLSQTAKGLCCPIGLFDHDPFLFFI